MGKITSLFIGLLLLSGLGVLFSYRILNSPLGLTADEGAFGINAVLLSKTLHDENGRFIPFFVLSLNGADWRQPVTQYYMAIFFKLFGASVFNLRFTSVIIALTSTILIFILAKEIFDTKFAFVASFIFLTTPIVLILSHMGLDNIMTVPFSILWIMFLYSYFKYKKIKNLFWAGVSLGIGFYTYKGMRAIVPIWCILTVGYLGYNFLKTRTIIEFKKFFKPALLFVLGVLPFFLIIPILNIKYAGAVFDHQGFNWDSWYTFLYPYFSSFDPSFLFIQGDATPWHSTGKHGMMLLASSPLFFVGIYCALKEKKFWTIILLAFFTAPLLFGFVNSVHRASRMMAIIPFYVLISTLGAQNIWEKKKILLGVIILVAIINFWDFSHFYWYKYPELNRQWFGDLSSYQDYVTLSRQSSLLHLVPYIDNQVASQNGISGRFFELAYLGMDVKHLPDTQKIPDGGILLTNRKTIDGSVLLDLPRVVYFIQIPQDNK